MAAVGGAGRCVFALLTLLLALGAASASHTLATSPPVERTTADNDVVLLNASAPATIRHAVQRSGMLGALPDRAVVAAPPIGDTDAPRWGSPEFAAARQFDSWIAERAPPVSS